VTPSFFFLEFMTGVASASSLFLLAVGLSLIFGALGIVNFAHGSFYMLGAYLLFAMTHGDTAGFWHYLWLVLAASIVIGAVAEQVFLRPVLRRPEHYQILLTYALLLIIEDISRIFFGSDYKSMGMPPGFDRPVILFGAPFPAYYLGLVALAGIAAAALWFFLHRTHYGRLVRAATQDREMLEALGINVPLLFTVVFAVGIGLAGFGGAVSLPLQSISTDVAVDSVISAFIVVVVGGLGSIWGAVLGAFLIGEIQAFGALLLPEFSIVFVYALMAIVLLFRPWGLLGRAPAVRT
jgi:branched-subunit amino acid ABC-type transport system permease component